MDKTFDSNAEQVRNGARQLKNDAMEGAGNLKDAASGEIKKLMAGRKTVVDTPAMTSEAKVAAKSSTSAAPVLPPDVTQYFFPVRGSASAYAAVAIGAAQIHFLDDKVGIEETRDYVFATEIADDAIGANWESAEECDCAVTDLEKNAEKGIGFGDLPAGAAKAKNYAAWNKTFSTWLFRNQKLDLLHSPSLDELSKPGEKERDFRVRLQQAAREARDVQKVELQAHYAPKLQALEQKKRNAEQKKEVEKQQSTSQILSSVMTAGAGILGAFLGRKTISATNITRAASAVRAAGRAAKEYGDVGRAEETVEAIDQQMKDLNAEFEAEVAALAQKVNPATEQFETVTIRPKKTNISVQLVALGWKAE